MEFILTAGREKGVADLAARLTRELAAGKKVLWLVSGGSNVSAGEQVMAGISDELSQRLTIMLADERYGPSGHKDSNWAQLLQAGLDGKRARLLPILEADQTFEQAVDHYNELATRAFADNDSVIAQLGIGGDGHIAGILPGSLACQEQTKLAAGYEAPPLTRLTLTFPALQKISAAYVFAFGNTKRQALSQLRDEQLEPSQQPAQILKQLSEAFIYNDQVGEQP